VPDRTTIVEIRRDLVATCPPATLFPYVEDLARYPAWMPLVYSVEQSSVEDAAPAWQVELRAKVGPFARSKQLRMVRAVHHQDRAAVFERAELDGRNHAEWVMRVALADLSDEGAAGGTRLTMTLRYGGALWTGGVLERVLDDQVRIGSEQLLDLVNARPTR
jgi:hypothetical protein